MRAQLLALTIAAAIAGPAATQAGEAPANAMQTFTSSSEITALIAKARVDGAGVTPLVSEPILSLAPYHANLEYRSGIAPPAVHEKDAEMMYVIDGTGSVVTGGHLMDEKRTNATNLTGSAIAGGNEQRVAKGDFLIVPENTPHQVIPGSTGPIVLMTLHVPRPLATPWP